MRWPSSIFAHFGGSRHQKVWETLPWANTGVCFSGVRETRLARKGHEMGLVAVGVVGQRTRSGLLRLAAGSGVGGGAHASHVSALPFPLPPHVWIASHVCVTLLQTPSATTVLITYTAGCFVKATAAPSKLVWRAVVTGRKYEKNLFKCVNPRYTIRSLRVYNTCEGHPCIIRALSFGNRLRGGNGENPTGSVKSIFFFFFFVIRETVVRLKTNLLSSANKSKTICCAVRCDKLVEEEEKFK